MSPRARIQVVYRITGAALKRVIVQAWDSAGRSVYSFSVFGPKAAEVTPLDLQLRINDARTAIQGAT